MPNTVKTHASTENYSTLLRWSMFILASLFYSLDYFQHTAPSVLITPIADSMHISFVTVGKIMSIYFPIYALSQIPAGYVIDKLGIRFALSLACLITSIGLAVMAYPSELFLIIGRVLIASGSAFAFIGALKTADLWLSKKIFPIAVGITNTLGVLGGVMGKPFLEEMIQVYSWHTAIFYISIFGFVLALILFLFLRMPQSSKEKEPAKASSFKVEKSAFKDIKLYLIALYAGIMVGTIVNAFSELYDVVFLTKTFALSAEKAATISSLMFIGIAVGGPLHGVIAKFFKQTKTWMIIASIGAMVSFASIIMIPNGFYHTEILSLSYFLAGFFVSSMLLAFAVVRTQYPEAMHATIFALINMIIGLCGFVFQWSLGHIIAYTNGHFIICFLSMLIPLLLSLVFIILGVNRHS